MLEMENLCASAKLGLRVQHVPPAMWIIKIIQLALIARTRLLAMGMVPVWMTLHASVNLISQVLRALTAPKVGTLILLAIFFVRPQQPAMGTGCAIPVLANASAKKASKHQIAEIVAKTISITPIAYIARKQKRATSTPIAII